MHQELQVIGRNVLVDFVGHKSVPAKVDTGADSSSIWASNISVDKNHVLSFTLFAEGSQFYTGKVLKRRSYKAAIVRSSSGHEQIRYRVEIPVRVAGRKMRVGFYLSDRSLNDFPILLGRRTLNKKFLVDVSQKEYAIPPRPDRGINAELMKNPYKFHKKYHKI